MAFRKEAVKSMEIEEELVIHGYIHSGIAEFGYSILYFDFGGYGGYGTRLE